MNEQVKVWLFMVSVFFMQVHYILSYASLIDKHENILSALTFIKIISNRKDMSHDERAT